MAPHQVARGKRWLEATFARICQEFKDQVVIAHWSWQDNEADFCLCFQRMGQAACEVLIFTRGTLRTCGASNPTYAPVRTRVEASIRHRFCALADGSARGIAGSAVEDEHGGQRPTHL